MKKRGQVTIFVVLGIVLLALAAGIFYFVNQGAKDGLDVAGEKTDFSRQIRPQIVQFVEGCIEEKAVEAIDVASRHGGIVMYDEHTLVTDTTFLRYAFKDGISLLDESLASRHIGFYIDLALPTCLDFSVFEEQDVTITLRPSTSVHDVNLLYGYGLAPEDLPTFTNVIISPTTVRVETEYNLYVEQGDTSFTIDRFTFEVPSTLGSAIRDAKTIQQQYDESNVIDLTFLTGLEPQVTIHPVDESTQIYSLFYGNAIPSYFAYAVESSGNAAPVLDVSPVINVKAGTPFSFQVAATDADNDAISFEASRFAISDKGIVSGTARAGRSPVTITATDSQGASVEKEVMVIAK
ncbi:TPA: hypothetical protein HA278_03380 [Candidatus Woesearchaeota archaeon]|nr:hypothetical protein [Candidatus Woesearchaeota archaeon]